MTKDGNQNYSGVPSKVLQEMKQTAEKHGSLCFSTTNVHPFEFTEIEVERIFKESIIPVFGGREVKLFGSKGGIPDELKNVSQNGKNILMSREIEDVLHLRKFWRDESGIRGTMLTTLDLNLETMSDVFSHLLDPVVLVNPGAVASRYALRRAKEYTRDGDKCVVLLPAGITTVLVFFHPNNADVLCEIAVRKASLSDRYKLLISN